MNTFEQQRRSLIFSMGGLGIARALPSGSNAGQSATSQGYVLGATEGEHLVHFRDGGDIFIRGGSATGSDNLAFGTQQVKVGTGIPIHRHFHMDEAFIVLEGSGTCMLNDAAHAFERGATIFIPHNAWHGFTNADHDLLLLWVVSPSGLDGFFRETCGAPGVPRRQLSREQINDIARRHDTEFR